MGVEQGIGAVSLDEFGPSERPSVKGLANQR